MFDDNDDGIPINTAHRVIVITRFLPSYGSPVVTHVEVYPKEFHPFENHPASEMERRFCESLLERVKKDFCSKFVEFASAQWFWSVHPLGAVDPERFRTKYLPY